MVFKIDETIAIRTKEIKFKSIKSTGPGGQNINKKSTAIYLSFDIINSKSISDDIKRKLLNRSDKYLTKNGKVVIRVDTYKSQNKNKSEAISRLIAYFKKSTRIRKRRIKTSPKKISIKKRLDDKRKNSLKKKLRKKPSIE